ncbi:MAG: hypothetical protein JNM17_20445 [Archangium sp.]|nr:hypothetical protein [Archangium sp.]
MTGRTSETIERQVGDIIRGYWRYGTAAAHLLEQFDGNEAALAIAADRFVRRWIEERQVFRAAANGDEKELGAVLKLLVALSREASPRFAAIVRSAADAKYPLHSGVSTLLLLAELRHSPDRWRDRLVAAALADGVEGAVGDVFMALEKHEPQLAYAVFDALATTERADSGAARLQAIALAVSRIGERVAFIEDATHLAQVRREQILDDSCRVNWAARVVLHARPKEAAGLLEHLGSIRDLPPKEFVQALQLLSAARERDRVTAALCELLDGQRTQYVAMVMAAMRLGGTYLFVGWAEHPGPVRIAKLMLERRQWEEAFWANVFAQKPNIAGEATGEAASRLRRCLVEALLLIACDATIDIADRRLALDAIGRSGHGRIAAKLGKVGGGELADAVQQARQRLSATNKGRPIEPATGVRIALDTYCASGEHLR